MSRITQFLFIATLAHQIFAYNVYRGKCGCYEARPVVLANRMGQAQPIVYFDNQLKKQMFYDPSGVSHNTYHANQHNKYQAKPQGVYYVQGTESEEVDNTKRFDSDNFWKVDEIPVHVGLLTLPDVYVEGETPQEDTPREDAPPSITDAVSVEKSELTAETHDLEDVEIEEKYLNDPAGEMEEIIMETVTRMPEPSSTENPAAALLKMAPLVEVEDEPETLGAIEEETEEEKEKSKTLMETDEESDVATTTEADVLTTTTEELTVVEAEQDDEKTEVVTEVTTEGKPIHKKSEEKIKADKTEKSKKSEGSAKAKGSKKESALL